MFICLYTHHTYSVQLTYADIDVAASRRKPKPAPQLPIEHQTAPSSDTFAEVDKPKRGSSKNEEPDVVPPESEGVSHLILQHTG